jgi:tetratricopeptide (TPR) repeat protein
LINQENIERLLGLLDQMRLEEARKLISAMRTEVDTDSELASLLVHESRYFDLMQQEGKARAAIEKAVGLSKADSELAAYIGLAQANFERKHQNAEGALALLERVRLPVSSPENDELKRRVLKMRAFALHDLGRVEESVEALLEFLRDDVLDDERPMAQVYLGMDLIKEQRFAEAIDWLHHALAGSLEHQWPFIAHYSLGHALLKLNRPQEALLHLKTASEGHLPASWTEGIERCIADARRNLPS